MESNVNESCDEGDVGRKERAGLTGMPCEECGEEAH